MRKTSQYDVTVEVAAEYLARLIDTVLANGGDVTGVAPLADTPVVENFPPNARLAKWVAANGGSAALIAAVSADVTEPGPEPAPAPVADATEAEPDKPRRRKRAGLTRDVIAQFLPKHSQFKSDKLERWIAAHGGSAASTSNVLLRLVALGRIRHVRPGVYATCAAPQPQPQPPEVG